jgi:hypothetical protein
MGPEGIAIGASLVALSLMLVALFVRDLIGYRRSRSPAQLGFGVGIALAAAAMAVEAVVYFGFVTSWLLQSYVFLSAAIVGVLSLGAVRVFRQQPVRITYVGYALATTALVGVASYLVPVPSGMVHDGIISGNPSVLLLVLSSLVTVPATVVLLVASAIALRRRPNAPTLLLISGALILGAGGALYIASFPVALYYAEFVGIVFLFFGVVNLPQAAEASAAHGAPGTGA